MDTKTNAWPQSLQDQQKMFKNRAEHKSWPYCSDCAQKALNFVVERICKISKCMEEEDVQEIPSHLCILYGNMMNLWDSLNVDVAKAIWHKYPNVCPYCLCVKSCSCISDDSKHWIKITGLVPFQKNIANMPQDVADWQKMFERLYGNINRIKSLTAIWFHFQSEVGELSHEIRRQDMECIRAESADVFAWFYAFCSKLNVDMSNLETYYRPSLS